MPVKVVTYTKGMSVAHPVYLDANFPISYLFNTHPKYQPANELKLELFNRKIEICVSPLVFDEVWHESRSWLLYTNPNISTTIVQRYIRNFTDSMLKWSNVKLLPTDSFMTRDSINYALDFHIQQNLGPRDSFHLAFAILSKAEGFITSDNGFDKLDGVDLLGANLTIYKY